MLDFQENIEDFKKKNIQVIAASCDSKERAASFIENLKVTFKIGYGLNAKEVSEVLGAYYDEEKGHLHATGFIVGPLGRVILSLYSKGTFDRLKAKECISFIESLSSKD